MASGSTSSEKSKFKTDPNSPLWKYVKMLEPLSSGGGYIWMCNGCGVQYRSSYSRVKAHLCNIPGLGIKACPGKNGVPIPQAQVLAYIQEQEKAKEASGHKLSHPLLKRGSRGMKPPQLASLSEFEREHVESHPFLPTIEEPRGRKRSKEPLETTFHNESREFVDQQIARCLCEWLSFQCCSLTVLETNSESN